MKEQGARSKNKKTQRISVNSSLIRLSSYTPLALAQPRSEGDDQRPGILEVPFLKFITENIIIRPFQNSKYIQSESIQSMNPNAFLRFKFAQQVQQTFQRRILDI